MRPLRREDLAQVAVAGDGEGLEHVLVRPRPELVHVDHHLPHQHPPLPPRPAPPRPDSSPPVPPRRARSAAQCGTQRLG